MTIDTDIPSREKVLNHDGWVQCISNMQLILSGPIYMQIHAN